jgi:hypothetical protein
MSSEIYEVPLSFFDGMNVVRDERIGDTHFVTASSKDGQFTFGIYFEIYERAKADLRNLRIDGILEK